MIENQHNDNLERFFKANLEGYSPTPSPDFWDRMDAVIPPRPATWTQRWLGRWKWLALGALLALLMGSLLLWQNDRRQLRKLHKTVAEQQVAIEDLERKTSLAQEAMAPNAGSQHPTVRQAVPPSSQPVTLNTTQPERQAFVPKTRTNLSAKASATRPEDGNAPERTASEKAFAASQTAGNQGVLPQGVANAVEGTTSPAMTDLSGPAALPMAVRQADLQSIASLGTVPINSVAKAIVPITRHRIKRPNNPYPGFSIEVGATALHMPMGRLFQQDTFLTGRTGVSYATSLRFNYEFNPRWAVQAGYQLTNYRAKRLALRYNSFPVMVKKRWAWSRRGHLEGKAGFSLNNLLSARTDSDGQSVKGLKTTWVGGHVGVAATWPISDKWTLVAGPNASMSLTPMTTGRHSWELGLGASLRYQL